MTAIVHKSDIPAEIEAIIPREQVEKIGGGDLSKGHKILDELVAAFNERIKSHAQRWHK